MDETEKKLKVGAVAEQFGVDPKTVSRWIRAGKLPAVKTPGGHHLVAQSDVDAFLKTPAYPKPE